MPFVVRVLSLGEDRVFPFIHGCIFLKNEIYSFLCHPTPPVLPPSSLTSMPSFTLYVCTHVFVWYTQIHVKSLYPISVPCMHMGLRLSTVTYEGPNLWRQLIFSWHLSTDCNISLLGLCDLFSTHAENVVGIKFYLRFIFTREFLGDPC